MQTTDITHHSIDKLIESKIRKIIILGRRGPMQAAFKIKEFRELTKMDDCHVQVDWSPEYQELLDFGDNDLMVSFLAFFAIFSFLFFQNSLPRPRKRIAELYKKILAESHIPKPNHHKECILKFFSTPTEIITDPVGGQVTGVRVMKSVMDDYVGEHGKIVHIDNSQQEVIPCGLVIRSIGYKSVPLDESLPFDDKRGVIQNDAGRVVDNPGLYCSGWAAFGATGVILNTMNASFEVGKNILIDIDSGAVPKDEEKAGFDAIAPLLAIRGAQIVDFIDWQKIDEYETKQGREKGKPREKIVNFKEIFTIEDLK